MYAKLIKNSFLQIKRKPLNFAGIFVLDLMFFSVFAFVFFNFMKNFTEKIFYLQDLIEKSAGQDTFEKIIAANAQISSNAASLFKFTVLFIAVIFVLYSIFTGLSSFFIKKAAEKRTRFFNYIYQHTIVSILFLVFLLIWLLLSIKPISSMAASGIFVFHYLIIAFFALILLCMFYLVSVAYSLIPEKSILQLVAKSFRKSIQRNQIFLFLLSLSVFLIVFLILGIIFSITPFLGIFFFLVLFFSCEIFARILMIESMQSKNKE